MRDHLFNKYAKFTEKLAFLTPWCAYQGVINVSFSENFAYVLNGWDLISVITKNNSAEIFSVDQPLMNKPPLKLSTMLQNYLYN